jgi:hypothetical protein
MKGMSSGFYKACGTRGKIAPMVFDSTSKLQEKKLTKTEMCDKTDRKTTGDTTKEIPYYHKNYEEMR